MCWLLKKPTSFLQPYINHWLSKERNIATCLAPFSLYYFATCNTAAIFSIQILSLVLVQSTHRSHHCWMGISRDCPFRAGEATAGCPRDWLFPGMRMPQSFWTPCSSVWPPSPRPWILLPVVQNSCQYSHKCLDLLPIHTLCSTKTGRPQDFKGISQRIVK